MRGLLWVFASLSFVSLRRALPPYDHFAPHWNEVRAVVEYFAFAAGFVAALELAWAAWLLAKRVFGFVDQGELRASVRAAATAMTAFHRLYSPHIVVWSSITDELDRGACNLYGAPAFKDCWFINFGLGDDISRIRSTRLIAVSKHTGEVIYDGESNDEG